MIYKMGCSSKINYSNGFTLVELIVVITIVGVIAGVVGFILLGTIDAWTFKFNRLDLMWDGRLAINRAVRDIRTIKDLNSVVAANSTEFEFINVDDVNIKYSLNGTDINRTENGSINKLAEDVSDLTFTYFDSNGNTISVPVVGPDETDIRRVRIDITLSKGGENLYLRSESTPRNF